MIFQNWVLKCNTSTDVHSKSRSRWKSAFVLRELLIRKAGTQKGKMKERRHSPLPCLPCRRWGASIPPGPSGVVGGLICEHAECQRASWKMTVLRTFFSIRGVGCLHPQQHSQLGCGGKQRGMGCVHRSGAVRTAVLVQGAGRRREDGIPTSGPGLWGVFQEGLMG